MRFKTGYFLLPILIGLFGYMLFSVYEEVKEKSIAEFNKQQVILAEQAARGIERFFNRLYLELSYLSNMGPIVSLNDQGKTLMQDFYKKKHDEIQAVTRIDATGKIIFTIPSNPAVLGKDISSQEHIRTILQTHKPVVSDVFKAVQGYRALAYHVPVFENRIFQGTIGVLIPFETLAKKYLEDIRIGEGGYAWVLSEKGVELYCPVTGHTGNTIFETSNKFPSVIAMAREALKGQRGTSSYTYGNVRGKDFENIKKLAVFLPINLGNTFWSIVVATPESEVLANLTGFRNKLFLIVALLMITWIAYSYYLTKAWAVLKEESKRKRVEEALKERTTFLDKIIDSSALSTWISDEKGTIIRINPACLAFFGATEEEVIGKYNLFKDVVIEKQGFMPDIKRVFEKGEVASILIDYDFGAVDHVDVKKATHKIINSILTPVLDSSGKVSNVIVQSIDLTEIKKAEGALRESEKKYRRLVENAVVGVYQVTKEGIFRFVNEKMAEMFGYDKPESLLDEVVNIVDLYVRPEERLALLRELDENGFIQGREVEFRKKDGGSAWLALSTRRTRDEEYIIYEGLMADITERKELEKELQQAQKMEAIGTLSGGIAHDFNNILGIILGNTELAMDDVPEWNPARRNLEEVRKACLRAKDVIQQILSFSRQTDSEKKPIKIAPIVRESLTLLRASIPTSIEIRSNIEAAEDTILGNSTQIHQILINLCGNATHAMEEAGGILEVHLKNISLDVKAASQYHDMKPGPYVKLSVKDTGHGIDTQTMKRIFDPYFTTKDVGKGTGMGLAMVHGIVKRHNGAISVQSKPGEGSSFHILFPLIEQVQQDAAEKMDGLPRGHERILFVDDENSIVEFNKQRLERLGYTVEIRTDSVKALSLFLSSPDAFDLVITDMTMPGMTGDILARELLKIRPDLPIILCTGYSARMSEEKATELGIKKYLEKPVEMENLARSVREVLDKQ